MPRESTDDLFSEAHAELRRLASAQLRRERKGHTLQTAALVNETYLRFAAGDTAPWKSKAHFLAISARAMRQILIQHARAKGAKKRGGGAVRIPLEEASAALGTPDIDVLAVEEALSGLEGLDERKARIVEMRFFAGMTLPEIAAVLGISQTTAEDDWYMARAWLRRRLA